jgi:hypothetical protein
MSVREVRGRASLTLFIDRVIDGGPDTVTAPDDALSVRDNPDLMLAGAGSRRCTARKSCHGQCRACRVGHLYLDGLLIAVRI